MTPKPLPMVVIVAASSAIVFPAAFLLGVHDGFWPKSIAMTLGLTYFNASLSFPSFKRTNKWVSAFCAALFVVGSSYIFAKGLSTVMNVLVVAAFMIPATALLLLDKLRRPQ